MKVSFSQSLTGRSSLIFGPVGGSIRVVIGSHDDSASIVSVVMVQSSVLGCRSKRSTFALPTNYDKTLILGTWTRSHDDRVGTDLLIHKSTDYIRMSRLPRKVYPYSSRNISDSGLEGMEFGSVQECEVHCFCEFLAKMQQHWCVDSTAWVHMTTALLV